MTNSVNVPPIETDRLTLVPLTAHYSTGMYKLWSSLEVCKFSGAADDFDGNPIPMPVTSPTESDKIIDFFARHQNETGKGFRWAVTSKVDNEFYGIVGYNSLGSCSEIAYHLHPDYWGKGFMTEACLAAINWAKIQYRAIEIEAFIDSQNIRSIGLIERLSFAPTEVVREGAERYYLSLQVTKPT